MGCFDAIRNFPADVGFYYRVLGEAQAWTHNPDLPLVAASVIKIPLMVTAFRDAQAGLLDMDEWVTVRPEDRMPSCGVLNRMHEGTRVTIGDLVTLMIIVSDNTAANLLIDRLTAEHVNGTMQALGIPGIALRRKLFDSQAAARGIQNTVTAGGMALLLERMYRGELLGEAYDGRMLKILSDQRLNGKIPFYLHSRGIQCAHKTGEDDNITHDVGIVYASKPFVLCMLSNRAEVTAFERLIQDTARACAFGTWEV